MKYSRNRAALAVVVTLVLILALLPIASLISLVYAAVPWTKIPSVSMGGELFVMDAYVIKNSDTDYEMWYTHGKTGLSLTGIANSLSSILTDDIVNDIANQDFESLLNDLSGIDIDALWDFLSTISTVVGYATSTDGINWTVANPEVLAGSSGGVFDSVGSPCVIKNSATDYEMWYTHAKTSLTKTDLGNILIDMGGNPAERKAAILDLMNSTTTAIGYAISSNGVDWTETPEVITGNGSGSLFNSVATPSVIKNSATDYEMWYSHDKTDLTEADLDAILDDTAGFGADELWSILNGASSVISYTTSNDGINWAVPQEVLAGSSGVWDSVATPSVIKRGSSYEMWYTHGTTDLTLTDFQNLASELLLLEPEFTTLWSDLNPVDLDQFLLDLIDLLDNQMDNVKALLANTSAVIGYATSGDGTTWTVQNPTAMVGASGSPWSSVGAPCVVYNSGVYEMWFTKGIDDLIAGDILNLLLGSELPIGYAYFEERSIDLVSDWNFIGLPVSPLPPNTEDVLSDIIGDVQTVWAYDAATGLWSYFTTIPGAPQGGLIEMTEGKGYWMELINPTTLILSGVETSLPYDIDLVVGWNLISIPETPSPSAIEDVLSGIIANVQTVWTYDAATGLWSYYTTIPGAPQGGLTEMTEGKAYWIEMTATDTLTIN